MPVSSGRRRVHCRRRDDAAGFTLIELIVTITLLGILVALSLPSFTAWIRNTQVRSTAEALQNGLRLAQAEAVRRNRPMVLTFTDATPALDAAALSGGGGKNWSLQAIAKGGDSATDATRFVSGGVLGDVASGVTIADFAGAGIAAICFSSNGRLLALAAPPTATGTPNTGVTDAACAGTPARFVVTTTAATRPLHVLVQLGGQVRMCDPNRPTLSSTSPDGCP